MKQQQDYDLVFSVCQMEKTKTRFMKKVQMHSKNECWIWLGAKGVSGHGQFFIKTSNVDTVQYKRKGLIAAHRASYMIHKRIKISAKKLACHKCDNPQCVNPDHIFIGTHKDNSNDCVNKGRWIGPKTSSGEDNPAHILNNNDIIFIRNSHLSLQKLADLLGVSKTTIWQAKTGDTWKQIEGSKKSKTKRMWTKKEIELLNDSSLSDKEKAKILKRPYQSVRVKRYSIGLIARTGERRAGQHVLARVR